MLPYVHLGSGCPGDATLCSFRLWLHPHHLTGYRKWHRPVCSRLPYTCILCMHSVKQFGLLKGATEIKYIITVENCCHSNVDSGLTSFFIQPSNFLVVAFSFSFLFLFRNARCCRFWLKLEIMATLSLHNESTGRVHTSMKAGR